MPDCIGPMPPGLAKTQALIRQSVEDRMQELMPGWFTMVDELMDPAEPFQSIHAITARVSNDLTLDITTAIREHFKNWFDNHPDGYDDWP